MITGLRGRKERGGLARVRVGGERVGVGGTNTQPVYA